MQTDDQFRIAKADAIENLMKKSAQEAEAMASALAVGNVAVALQHMLTSVACQTQAQKIAGLSTKGQ